MPFPRSGPTPTSRTIGDVFHDVAGRRIDLALSPIYARFGLAAMAGFVDRPVIDKPGLKGMYCTTDGQDPMMAVMSQIGPPGGGRGRGASHGPPGDGADGDSAATSLFTVVQEKLGLRLEPQKLPTEILVVDRVERPSAN